MLARSPALVRQSQPFDSRTYNFASNTGPRIPLSAPASKAGEVVWAQNAVPTTNRGVHLTNAGGAWVAALDTADVTLADSLVEFPIVRQDGNSSHPTRLLHSQIKPGPDTASGGAAAHGVSFLSGVASHCDISAPDDGLHNGTKYSAAVLRTLVEYSWIHADGGEYADHPTYGGGAPGTGTASSGQYMTDAQALQAAADSYSPSKAVTVGEFIPAQVAGNWRIYEVTTAGNLETTASQTSLTWPTTPYTTLALGDTTQPFTSGSAQLVCVGNMFHADGIQFTQGGLMDLVFGRIEGYPDTAMIVQSALQPADGLNVPIQSVHIRGYYFSVGRAAFNWLDWGASPGVTDIGGYLRSSPGVWTVNPNAWKGNPWSGQIQDCWFGDSADGRTPDMPHAISSASCTFVPSVAAWLAGVGAQYDLDVVADADTLRSMWMGTFDWTNSTPALNTSVMEARIAAGLTAGQCDARGWLVWANNRREHDGALLTPTYYTGV